MYMYMYVYAYVYMYCFSFHWYLVDSMNFLIQLDFSVDLLESMLSPCLQSPNHATLP